MCVCTGAGGVAALLADGLQGVQGAFDVADLRCQGVYGLHGAIQLLTASHQRVHALWRRKHKGKEGGDALQQTSDKQGERKTNNSMNGLHVR